MYNVQNQQLPFNPQQQQTAFLNIQLGNPPYLPDCPTEAWMRDYMPVLASMVAIEVQSKAQMNALRMFMFNQNATNNFANPDFHSLVCGIADYLVMAAKKNMYPNIEVAVQDAVPRIVEMMCAFNMQQYPVLERYVDPNIVPAVRQSIMMFNQLCAEISNFKNQVSRFGGGQPMGGAFPSTTFGNNPYAVGGQAGGSWGGRYGNPDPTPMVRPSVGGGTSLFTNATSQLAPQNNQPSFGGGRYSKSSSSEAAQVVKQPFTAVTINKETQNMSTQQALVTDKIPADKVKWKPSIEFPYFPAYNPYRVELFFTVNENNHLKPVFEKKDFGMMDYDRHGITTVFGQAPALKMQNEEFRQINDSANEQSGDAYKKKIEFLTKTKDTIIIESCEKMAWFTGCTERLTLNENPLVYRTYALVYEPVVLANGTNGTNGKEFVTNLGKSKTFIELREKMNASLNDIDYRLWNVCNQRMTGLINRIIRQSMSIPRIFIESFVDDIGDLIKMLDDDYGSVVKDAFLKNQADFIHGEFELQFDDVSNQLSSDFLSDYVFPEGVTPSIIYLASNYSMTHLNCFSHELELTMSTEAGSAITDALTPLLRKIVVDMFEDASLKEFKVARHLIRTLDNRILEISRGLIGDDFYTAMLVK